MALIKCPDCGREVSDKASACPNCAHPFAAFIKNADKSIQLEQAKLLGDEAFLRGDFKEAYKYYTIIVESSPSDYERKFKRMLAFASGTTLNEKGNITGPLSHISEYCMCVKDDDSIPSEEKETRIISAFSEISSIITGIHNLAVSVFLGDMIIMSSYESYLEVCIFSLNKYLELFDYAEKEYFPAMESWWEASCNNCITILLGYSNKYTDTVYHKSLYLSEAGQSTCYTYSKMILAHKKKTSPSYTLPPQLVSPIEGGTGAKIGACYIATAVYGSYDCKQVRILRMYRDNTLSKKWYGEIFIRFYYLVSPVIVRYLGESKLFKRFWKRILDSFIKRMH